MTELFVFVFVGLVTFTALACIKHAPRTADRPMPRRFYGDDE